MYRTKEYYKSIIKQKKDIKRLSINAFQSFFFGGSLCIMETILYKFFLLGFNDSISKLLVSMSVILTTGILTAFGVYNKFGQIAKCGLAISIYGFANACISSDMEYKKEGLILGIASNCLKLAGAVIVFCVTSAFF